jgi:hypothetical protein
MLPGLIRVTAAFGPVNIRLRNRLALPGVVPAGLETIRPPGVAVDWPILLTRINCGTLGLVAAL